MQYAALVRDAWALTWRFRVLWILGLFAGVTGTTLSLGRSSLPSGWSIQPAEAGIVAVVVGVGVALAALSVFARGGITQLTVDVDRGQPISILSAWRAGARWFWRFSGLLVLLAVLAASVLGGVALAVASLGGPGAALGALVLTLGAVASIVLAYAERATVVHDLGMVAALQHGWRLLREHLSTSLLTWIVSVGLAAIVALLASFSAADLIAAGTLMDVVTASVVLVLIVAIGNAFLWSYWTLAYLRLDPEASSA